MKSASDQFEAHLAVESIWLVVEEFHANPKYYSNQMEFLIEVETDKDWVKGFPQAPA